MPIRSRRWPSPPDPAAMAAALIISLGVEDAERFCDGAFDLLTAAGQPANERYWRRVGVMVTYFASRGARWLH